MIFARAALVAGVVALSCLGGVRLVAGSRAVGAEPAPAGAYAGSPIAEALQRADATIARIVAVPGEKRTFENTVGAIDDMFSRLNKDTAMLQFMQYVSTDAGERERSAKATEDFSNYLIELSKREDLYRAVSAYAATTPALEGERARLLAFILRDYKRDGMELPKEKRERLKEVQKEIQKLGLEFEKNIRDDETVVLCAREELLGMPVDVLAGLARVGDLYALGMDYPTTGAVRETCEVEGTRQKVWAAFKRRGGAKNVEVLEKMLKLRAEVAGLLGYATYADYEQEVLMAKNSQTVAKFYSQLRPLVRKKAELDYAEFQAAKREYTGDEGAVLMPWDYDFYKQRLLKSKYAVDSQKVREYFPMDRAIEGLFTVTGTLFGLEYKDVTGEASQRGRTLWHPDVKLYEVVDKASGEVLGEFFFDLYPRANKYTHVACWGLLERKEFMDGARQKPLSAIVGNFTKPTADKPSLLSHDEVETMFHEFGHCLHNILSEAKLARFAGTSVERDFVEAPSQIFENWVWQKDVLALFAKHYKTGEGLPDAMLEGMSRAKYLASGLDAENQFFYGLTDQAYHTAAGGEIDTTAAQDRIFGEVTMYKPVRGTRYQAGFGHLVGYQAGYYGYMWSLVYASDMFSKFKAEGAMSPSVGGAYRREVLGRGGSRDGLDSVKAFLGREPEMKSFLAQLGLEATESK